MLRCLEGLKELNGLAVEREALFSEDVEENQEEEEEYEEGFVSSQNIVLEESNEDGTLSNEHNNYNQQ